MTARYSREAHTAGQFSPGDTVSNGHWIGRVIASTRQWAWVQPVSYVQRGPRGETVPYAFSDGPLTFAHGSLQPAAGEG